MTRAARLAGELIIEIGGMPIRLRAQESFFLDVLAEHYSAFVKPSGGEALCDLEVRLASSGRISDQEDVRVRRNAECWLLERSDLHAELAPNMRRGTVFQSANLFSTDTVLRLVHTLLLSVQGGFLLHAASSIRNGRAFVFSGPSGAGKTTMTRLAPQDATILTDEISYIRKQDDAYCAFGTPFSGELARAGENVNAPIASLYLLEHGAENRIEPMSGARAGAALLRNILFFAEDAPLVERVFDTACDLVSRIPVSRLKFAPDARVWEMIG
jgi:hypothetical protein